MEYPDKIIHETLTVGHRWWVKFPTRVTLDYVCIKKLSNYTIAFDVTENSRYRISDIEFVELVDHANKMEKENANVRK